MESFQKQKYNPSLLKNGRFLSGWQQGWFTLRPSQLPLAQRSNFIPVFPLYFSLYRDCINFFCYYKITWLKERFTLTHGFTEFSPWLFNSMYLGRNKGSRKSSSCSSPRGQEEKKRIFRPVPFPPTCLYLLMFPELPKTVAPSGNQEFTTWIRVYCWLFHSKAMEGMVVIPDENLFCLLYLTVNCLVFFL